MRLIITDQLFELFPETILGVVVGHNLDNRQNPPVIGDLLQEAEATAVKALGQGPIIQHPHIAPWREAYRTFGAKPKKYPSSIESLGRRVLKGQSLPRINTLVDLYNAISLRYLLPAGAEDLDKIDGDVLLTIASNAEVPVKLLGEPAEKVPLPGEVLYKDNIGAICRRWNWREADRTKLTEDTRNVVMVLEGLPPITTATIENALNDLAALVTQYCGGTVTTAILNKDNPIVDL